MQKTIVTLVEHLYIKLVHDTSFLMIKLHLEHRILQVSEHQLYTKSILKKLKIVFLVVQLYQQEL